MISRKLLALLLLVPLHANINAAPHQYTIDTDGAHAAINFRVSHLGISWLTGRFNNFEGSFTFDSEAPNASKAHVTIDLSSVDSNHVERDNHLRGKDFLNTETHPKAIFSSTAAKLDESGNGQLIGDLTLNGVTRSVILSVSAVGAGPDPWGSYRRGFEATATIRMMDFGMTYNLGPASETVELVFQIEGIRQ